jgi:hypothetical protein
MESRLKNLVQKMHQKFELQNNIGPIQLSTEEKAFRIVALREEITEYEESTDLVDQYDALLDLLVFAVGTLDRHGFPLLAGFEVVMAKNMQKELASSASASKRGFARDLVKPKGFTGPEADLRRILEAEVAKPKNTQAELFQVAPMPANDVGSFVPGVAPKWDGNKPRVDLLPVFSMMEISKSLGFGAKKYFDNSWRTGDTVVFSRTYASILRHLFTWWSGEDLDQESGVSHLANAGAQLVFLIEHAEYHKDKDDRFKRGAA